MKVKTAFLLTHVTQRRPIRFSFAPSGATPNNPPQRGLALPFQAEDYRIAFRRSLTGGYES
jgi:hypothetical protein